MGALDATMRLTEKALTLLKGRAFWRRNTRLWRAMRKHNRLKNKEAYPGAPKMHFPYT